MARKKWLKEVIPENQKSKSDKGNLNLDKVAKDCIQVLGFSDSLLQERSWQDRLWDTWLTLTKKVKAVDHGLMWNDYWLANLGKEEVWKRVKRFVQELVEKWYALELWKMLRNFEVSIHTDLSKIQIWWWIYKQMTIESKKKYILYKIYTILKEYYKFNFIDWEEEPNSEDTSSQKIQNIYGSIENKDEYIHKFILERIHDLYRLLKKSQDIGGNISKVIPDNSILWEFRTLFISEEDFDLLTYIRISSYLNPRDQRMLDLWVVKIGGVSKNKVASKDEREIEKLLIPVFSRTPENMVLSEKLSEDNLGFSFFSRSFNIHDSKEIGFSKLEQIYIKYLPEIINSILQRLDTQAWISHGLQEYDKNSLLSFSEFKWLRKEKNDWFESREYSPTFQSSYSFELQEDLTKEQISYLQYLFMEEISKSSQQSKKNDEDFFDGYLNLWEWYEPEDCTYRGFFKKNSGFEGDNIIYISDQKSWKKSLHINLSNFSADKFAYITIQIAYLLQHGKFLNKEDLYTNLYHAYNEKFIEWSKIYPVECFHELYSDFIKKIIYPLSLQYLEQNGKTIKSSSTIFLWLHGTWKSQFIMNLLQNKVFNLWNNSFNLNATVIPINLLQLKEMLEDDFAEIKQRLIQVSENTKIPIVLVIEDIDTLMSDDPMNPGLFDQMLTNLFEGVWALPNITIIASSNYPEKISPRMIRQNRFENIMLFKSLTCNEEVVNMFKFHIKNMHLEDILWDELIQKYAERFIWTTPSHIANFISEISRENLFRKQIGNTDKISEKDISEIFNKLNMNFPELQRREEEIGNWLSEIRKKDGKPKIGF